MNKPITLSEAIAAVSDEYNAECNRARNDRAFHTLMQSTMEMEYDEIDAALPEYAGEIFAAQRWPEPILDPRIYQALCMFFRMGMRVQRKLDHPDQPTTFFWRSDQKCM